MRRASFRRVLKLAAVAGDAVMGSKVAKSRSAARPAAPAPSTTWPPLSGTTEAPTAGTGADVLATAPEVDAPPATVDVAPVVSADPPPPLAAAEPVGMAVEDAVPSSAADEPTPSPLGDVGAATPDVETVAVLRPSSGSEVRTDDTVPMTVPPSVDEPATGSAPAADAGTGAEGSSGRSWTFGGEGDTDSDRSAGSPLRADNPSLDPEPEAVLPPQRIDAGSDATSLVAHGDEADVPPAPEPTFGTAPDPEAAATAPVHVATPIEMEPEEPLAIPHRPGHDEPGATS